MGICKSKQRFLVNLSIQKSEYLPDSPETGKRDKNL